MGVFTVILIIFTAAFSILTATLYGILIGANLFKVDYGKAGVWSFIVSTIGIVAAILIAGDSYAIVCTWLSGLSVVGILGFLVTLLIRSVDWR